MKSEEVASPSSADSDRQPQTGDLYLLSHGDNSDRFSGYGLITRQGRRNHLTGLLMVDRPQPLDPNWLSRIEEVYGEYQLAPMTATGERGIACQMWVAPSSVPLLRRPRGLEDVQAALLPLLDERPNPILKVRWNGAQSLWQSEFWIGLPEDMQAVFDRNGPGCFAAERESKVGFITHARDSDIESFHSAPVLYCWELIEMPTAPLIRFRGAILDNPDAPYVLEHFLNIDDPDQARLLDGLIQQEALAFDFFGEVYEYRYSKHFEHPPEMRQQLEELVRQAQAYWDSIPPAHRDFDRAKAAFQLHFAP